MSRRSSLDRPTISRRQFFRLSAVATAGAGLAACGGEPPAPVVAPTAPAAAAPTAAPAAAAPTAAPAAAAPTAAPAAAAPTAAPAAAPAATPGKFNEAPMLAELVKAGSLPAVDQRLPAKPLVVPVIESNGKYGGTIRRGFRGVSDRVGPTKVQNEGLTWYNADLTVRANLAESWEVNADATEWTFKIRDGVKWSDGAPLNSDNFKWWYDNLFNNETLRTLPDFVGDFSAHFTSGPERTKMTMDFPDATTVKFKFAHPKPLFLLSATRQQPFMPGEYLKQFHIDLAPDKAALEAATKAANFDAWDKLFEDRQRWYLNPERPTIGPWVAKNPLSQELFTMERNPYFWQVDSDGNQLPYVDKVTHRLHETPDVFNLWIVNGEIDFQARNVSIGDYTLLKENEAKGDYKVFLGVSANHIAFQPNQTTKNEKLREFFNNRDVRIALSLAVDRNQINELVFAGQAVPRQYSPLSVSPQYYEKLSKAYIEYDVAKANELLDKAGYDKKDAEGFRKWKDGSDTLSFIIEGTAQAGSPDEDAVQEIVKYFAAVGIKATYKAAERSLYEEHYRANEIEGAFWGGDRTVLPLAAPIIFIGTQADRPWADAWSLWKNNPKDPNGQEPPKDHYIQKLWSTWDQVSVEPDEQKRNALFQQILDIWAEELPMIGYLGEIPAPIIVKNGLHNYKEGLPIDDTTEDENLLNPQTYFWDEPEKHV